LRVGAAHALAFGKVVASLAPSTFIRQVFFLAALALYISLIGRPTALQVISLFLFGNVFAILVQWFWCRGITSSIDGPGRDVSDWGKWLRFGVSMAPALLFVQYARDLTLIFSAWGLRSEDVAVLGIVTALVAFVKFAVAAINQSITAKMAKLIVEDRQAELAELINTSNHMKLWPVLICFGIFAVFGEAILSIFGEPFDDHSNLLLILMLEPLALAFFGPGGQYISLSGRQRALLPAALVAIGFMMVAINAGIWAFGLPGAAFGVAVTWIAWSSYLAFYVRKQAGIDLTFITSLKALMKKQST
jgi:O-antigen/teichoic acid export membrane protein